MRSERASLPRLSSYVMYRSFRYLCIEDQRVASKSMTRVELPSPSSSFVEHGISHMSSFRSSREDNERTDKGFAMLEKFSIVGGARNNGYLNIFIRVCNQPIEGLDGFVRFSLVVVAA